MSHWIPPFTRRNPLGQQHAYCGRLVTEKEHATPPTCPDCLALLKDDEETDAHLTELLNTPNPRPVKVEHFDPCHGYRLKGSKR